MLNQLSKYKNFFGLIFITGITQTLVQFTGFISGIVIIRYLSIEQYAIYTLANTMLGVMVILADSGISSGVNTYSGRVWDKKIELGRVIATGIYIRKIFFLFVVVVTMPVLYFLLTKAGATLVTASLIIAAVVFAFYLSLTSVIYETPLMLHQDLKFIQFNQLINNLLRFLLTTVGLFIFPFTIVAILCSSFSQLLTNRRIFNRAKIYIEISSDTDLGVKNGILSIVKKMMPGSIFYTVSGQLSIWLLSFKGSTVAIAQLGALGRLAIILSILGSVISILFAPRFSRMKGNRKEILLVFNLIILFTSFFLIFILFAVYFFPGLFLWFLGGSYDLLGNELLLSFISASFLIMNGLVYNLPASRGHVFQAYFSIPVHLLIIIIGIFLFDFETSMSALSYSVFVSIFSFFFTYTTSIFTIYKSDNA